MNVRELVTILGFELRDEPLQKYDKEIDSTKAKSDGLAKAAKGIGTAYKIAAAATAVAVGWISKNIIQATLEMEGYRSQMEAFTGSAESAAEALAGLRGKTGDALFGTGTLVNAYKQLRTIGMGAEDTSKMIDVLSDCANGSAENFNALGNILTRVSTTGKVNEAVMRQLTNAGFGAQDMAQGLGITQAQLNARIAAGQIGFNELSKAMQGAASEGGRFFGNAEKQARTLGGSLKILKSTINDIGDGIGTKVTPRLVELIRYVTDFVKLGKTGLVDFGAKAFDYMIHAIWQVIIFFEVLKMRMEKYGGAFTPLKEIFKDVFGFLKSVASSAYPFLMYLAQLILVAFKPIQAFVKPILETLKPIIQNIFGYLSDAIGALIPLVDGLTPYFRQVGEAVSGMLSKLAPLFNGIISFISPLVKALMAFFAPIIKTVWPPLQRIFTQIGKLFEVAGEQAGALGKIIQILTPIFSFLGKTVGFALGIVFTVIEKVIQAFTFLIGLFTKGTDSLSGVFSPFEKLFEWFKAKFPNLYKVLSGFAEYVKGIFKGIAGIVKAVVGYWIGLFKAVFNAITGIIGGIVGIFKAIFGGIFAIIKNTFGAIFNTVFGIWDEIIGIWSGSGNIFQKIGDSIKLIFTKIWEGIKQIAVGNFQAIFSIVKAFGNFFKKVFEGIAGIISAFVNGIKSIGQAIGGYFTAAFGWVKKIISGMVEFIKKNALNIVNIVLTVLFPVAGIVLALVRLIIKHWDSIKEAVVNIWNAILSFFRDTIDKIVKIWEALPEFFSGLWKGIIDFAVNAWETFKAFFGGLVDDIMNIWNGITGFFAGLWEAVKQGPKEAIEHIKNAFFGLFDGIREKFLEFINIIKNGWESVKGFLGGVVSNVVNFVTGGDSGKNTAPQGARPTNDMLLTPDGNYSMNPKDTIFAMQNPGDLLESLFKFISGGLGGLQLQSAYAGAPAGVMGKAMNAAAAQNTYNSSSSSSRTSINAPINAHTNIKVDAAGMSPEAVTAAVQRGVEDGLNDVVNSVRGTIPYGEAKRNL